MYVAVLSLTSTMGRDPGRIDSTCQAERWLSSLTTWFLGLRPRARATHGAGSSEETSRGKRPEELPSEADVLFIFSEFVATFCSKAKVWYPQMWPGSSWIKLDPIGDLWGTAGTAILACHRAQQCRPWSMLICQRPYQGSSTMGLRFGDRFHACSPSAFFQTGVPIVQLHRRKMGVGFPFPVFREAFLSESG